MHHRSGVWAWGRQAVTLRASAHFLSGLSGLHCIRSRWAGRCCGTNHPGRYHLCQFAGRYPEYAALHVSFRVNCAGRPAPALPPAVVPPISWDSPTYPSGASGSVFLAVVDA